jgi:hypothetical protein
MRSLTLHGQPPRMVVRVRWRPAIRSGDSARKVPWLSNVAEKRSVWPAQELTRQGQLFRECLAADCHAEAETLDRDFHFSAGYGESAAYCTSRRRCRSRITWVYPRASCASCGTAVKCRARVTRGSVAGDRSFSAIVRGMRHLRGQTAIRPIELPYSGAGLIPTSIMSVGLIIIIAAPSLREFWQTRR